MISKRNLFLTIFSILVILGILTAVIGKIFFVIDEDEKVSVVWTVDIASERIKKSEGEVTYTIPEVYEMVQVLTALAMKDTERPYVTMNSDGEYYEEVIENFEDFEGHPAVEKTKEKIEANGYSRIRTIFFYELDEAALEDGNISIERRGIYKNEYLSNYFEDYIELLEDFARQSDFHSFYEEHEAYYQNLIDIYGKNVPVDMVWKWLEERCPVSHDAYHIILSPLIGGSHNTYTFRDSKGEYSEIAMFLSAPNGYTGEQGFSEAWQPSPSETISMIRNLFTEVDHNYINPITNREENIRLALRYFSDLEKWNNKGSYGRAALTFNEYMTWGVYLLFASDTYPDMFNEELFKQHFDTTVQLMNYRGFYKFEGFAEKLLEVYTRADGTQEEVASVKEMKDIPSLYGPMLQWAKRQ